MSETKLCSICTCIPYLPYASAYVHTYILVHTYVKFKKRKVHILVKNAAVTKKNITKYKIFIFYFQENYILFMHIVARHYWYV